MRDRNDIRTDRFAAFPFSIGCVSQSAVSVADQQQKKPQLYPPASKTPAGQKTRGQSGIVVAGIQRLMESFKSLSQLFVVYEDEEEEEREMVIGIPTDVQHVGHIGWDGLNKVGGLAKSRSEGGQDQFLNLSSSLSWKQFELAMEVRGGGLGGHK